MHRRALIGCCTHAWRSYESQLDKHQRQARDAFQAVIALYEDEELRNSDTWLTVCETLKRLGQQFDMSDGPPRPVNLLAETSAVRSAASKTVAPKTQVTADFGRGASRDSSRQRQTVIDGAIED